MRVCLLSKFGESSNLLYGGTRLGLEANDIQYIDININRERHENPPHWISIPQISPQHPKPEDKLILEKIKSFKPDLILLIQYGGIPFLIDNAEQIKSILGKHGKTAFWFVDLAKQINENPILGKNIDIMFLSNAGQLEEYKKKWQIKDIFFMPQGCYVIDTFSQTKSYKYNVVFLGRRQQNDLRYAKRNKILNAFKNKTGLTEFTETIDLETTMKLYQESKIILGSSWRNDIECYSSDRIFNVLGAGGFYLCSYFPGIEKMFRNRDHLVWFKTTEEGIQLAEYYLIHDKEREKIAYNGYELVKNKHTYQDRLKNIIDIVQNNIHQFSGFLTL